MARISELNSTMSRPRLSSGVDPKALGYCWGPGMFMAVMVGGSVGWWWALLPIGLCALAHLILRWAYRKDPHIFALYARYSLLGKAYQPFVREKLNEHFQRPARVGRHLRF